MKNRRGFTLVELIISIVLLGVIGGIIIYNVTSVASNSKRKQYENFVNTVKSAANVYAANKPEAFNELYSTKAFLYITTGDLIKNGYLDENLVNPYTKEKIDQKDLIKAILDSVSGALMFEYPSTGDPSEQFMVGINDYVIYGEPYNCYQGIGTYRLSLSDEKGNLINLTEKTKDKDGKEVTNKEKYHFECHMPSDWSYSDSDIIDGQTVDYSRFKDENGNIYPHTTKAGTYDIEYTWIADSGVKKKAIRKVSVLEEFKPLLDVREVSVSNEYKNSGDIINVSSSIFDNSTISDDIKNNYSDKNKWTYNPVVNCKNNTVTVLAFRPILTGADLKDTKYTITKQINNGSYLDGEYKNIRLNLNNSDFDGRERNDFNHVFIADDGDVKYNLKTTTKGHYFKEYIKNDINDIDIEQYLVINLCNINGSGLQYSPDNSSVDQSSVKYSTQRDYLITDTYSPVGIDKYEYRYVSTGDTSPSNDEMPTLGSINLFNRTGNPTNFKASVLTPGRCIREDRVYEIIYFRAINKYGYVGNWTPIKLHISNKVSDQIESNLGDDCNSSCAPTNKLNQALFVGTSLEDLTCYYCQKKININYGGTKFNILGKFNDNKILLASDTSTKTSGTEITNKNNGNWSVYTCDGTFSTNFNYYSPVFQKFINTISTNYNGGEVKYNCQSINLIDANDPEKFSCTTTINPIDKILGDGADELFADHTWHAMIGKVDYTKMPSLGKWSTYQDGSHRNYDAQWNDWAKSASTGDKSYTGKFGLPTENEVSMVFKDALTANYDYWLASTFTLDYRRIQVKGHSDNTTVKDTYFKYLPANSIIPYPKCDITDGICLIEGYNDINKYESTFYDGITNNYIGNTHGLKLYSVLKDGNICAGDGTSELPFTIAG